MRIIRIVMLMLAVLMLSHNSVNAQLKKSANTEKIKSFTNGSVSLYKTSSPDGATIYWVSLRNHSQYLDNIILNLGNKEDMIKNLNDLSSALEDAKKGDHFDFSANGVKYSLSFDKVLGQKCFVVREPTSIVSDDCAWFFKATIDSILKYFRKTKDNK